MTRQFQEYHGAAPQSAQVSGKQVPYFGGIPQNGAAVDQALGQLAGTAERFAELHDQGVKQRATQERNKLRAEMDMELADAASQAWGTDESLFRKDGSVNTDRCDAIVAKYRERNQSVSPGDFLLDRNGAQHWHDQELEHEDIGLRVTKFASRQSLENVRTAFEDNYENAVLRQDWDGAARLVDDVCGSLLTSTQAENRKLKIQQMRERVRLAALKEKGKAGDGRVVTAEMMQSLKNMPVQETQEDVSGLVSTTGDLGVEGEVGFSAGNAGLVSLPSDELMAGFNVAQRLADSGSVTMNPRAGILEYELPPSPGESTQKVVGVAQAFKGYSLADYRNSIAKVAAGYFGDDRMSGMSDAQLVDALVNEVQMDGAADAWFEGDSLAYKGWMKTELSNLLLARSSGAAHAADRIMTGAEGRAGLNELLAQEVTKEEIASLGYGFNAVSAVTKGGLRDNKDKLVPAFRQAVQEYERYRERWIQELKAKGDEYEPSSDEDMAKAYKDDWQAFGKWYMSQGDLYKTRYDALADGVCDVYRQRAVDAVATLRQSGSFQLGTEVVQLDGKSDWAKEEKVLRYVLRQPLTDKELGSAKALAATKEKLHRERKARAAMYAQAYAEHKKLLKGKQAAIAEEKARDKQEKKDAEELEKVLKQADDERLAGYGRKVERKVTFGSVGKAGEAEPAAVVVPRKMYAEAAGALGASGGGFYAFIPGVEDGIPVMAGDVETVQFNAPVLNLLDGKKDKLTGQQLRALANEGLMIPVQFSAFQKF